MTERKFCLIIALLFAAPISLITYGLIHYGAKPEDYIILFPFLVLVSPFIYKLLRNAG